MNDLLFIDDEAGVRRSLARALKREPYTTHTVSGGEEALRIIERKRSAFSTVIADYKMPGMDGITTLVAIGRVNPEITRILLTGYATMDAAIQSTNEGLDGFLTKPFDNTELRLKIREITVRKRLRQLVSEPVLREIEASPEALAPRFHDATILFSDIRGFTSMSRNVHPEKVAMFLNNHYFTPMAEIACGNDGSLDKNIGDSMMVVFGAPVSRPDDVIRAVRTAVDMQRRAREIDAEICPVDGMRLKTGIGIASGYVISGIFGSTRKKEFTSIGMPVNIASRLQKLAKPWEILLCPKTGGAIDGTFPVEPLPPVLLKGFDTPMPIFRVVQ